MLFKMIWMWNRRATNSDTKKSSKRRGLRQRSEKPFYSILSLDSPSIISFFPFSLNKGTERVRTFSQFVLILHPPFTLFSLLHHLMFQILIKSPSHVLTHAVPAVMVHN